jgi:tRNA modification GTPase
LYRIRQRLSVGDYRGLLSQAEAIADLIAARSERARALSVQQLAGKLGERVRELRGALVDLCALLELDLDFSEEGLDLITRREIRERILGVERSVREMLDRYENGRIVREGATVVITGRPNAGKSSLFNALLKEHRAIVTPHPGTTRDTIEENVLLGGVLFRLVDTAGLRQAIDLAEREGVNRALESVRAADIILLVHDTSIPIKQWEIESILGSLLGNQHLVVAMNKTDLSGIEFDANEREKLLNRGARVVRTSAKSGQGIEELREALAGSVSSGTIEGFQGVEITNDRHRDALQRAHQSLQKSLDTNESGQWKEFIALDVREATSALGEITGEVSSEEILNRIFANFCIGK